MKKQILALFLMLSLAATPAHAFLGSVLTTIKDYHLDTMSAFTIPAYLVYRYMSDMNPKVVKLHAEQVVDHWKNAKRVYTIDEVNRALDTAGMTEEELSKDIKSQAIASGLYTSLLFGALYSILRYCEPSYNVSVRFPITSYSYGSIPAPFPPR